MVKLSLRNQQNLKILNAFTIPSCFKRQSLHRSTQV